jgi:uncharacterized protein YndB with AHSA1/START domain
MTANDPGDLASQLTDIERRLREDATRKLVMKRRFNASPARVFDAWTKPELAGKWLFHGGPGSERATHILPAKVDAKWTVISRRDGVDYKADGFYLEVDRPRRLAFTFGMPEFPGNLYDRVIVEFEDDGEGGCLMTFTEEGCPEEYKGGLEHGYTLMFDLGLKPTAEDPEWRNPFIPS